MAEHVDEFFISHGFCKQLILNGSSRASLGTTQASTLYIVDSKKINNLLIFKVPDGQTHFGHYFENRYDYRSLVLKYSIHDKSIYDGVYCINYDNIENYSYGQCIENAFEQRLQRLYHCLPPWIQNSAPADICEYQNLNFPKPLNDQEWDELNKGFRDILMGVIHIDLIKDWLKSVSQNYF